MALHLLLVILSVIASAGVSMITEESNGLQEDKGAFLRTATAEETLELGMEFHRLESKISGLDESRGKDLKIKQLEKVIEEKSNLLHSLHNIDNSLQAKQSSGVKGQLGVEDDRVNEVEKQVIKLKVEIDSQNKKKEELQLQVNVAEKRLEGMSLKLENLQNIKNEQRLKIHNTRHSLHVTEEEMLNAKQETSSLAEQLKEAHQWWLPSWIFTHLVYFQSFVTSYWNEHGRPPFDSTLLKVLEKKTELEKWVHPHLKAFKTKLLPIIEKHCKPIVDDLHPIVQSLSTQATEFYHASHSTFAPHVVKIAEITDQYVQKFKILTKPYIDQLSKSVKPHLEKTLLFLRPYSKHVVHNHKRFTRKVRLYHSRVQANLFKMLKSFEFTEPLATEGLVWFMSTVLLALPVIILCRLLLRQEPKKHRRHSYHTNHGRRKSKRAHSNK